MRKRDEDYMAGNLVAMIDVVFQLIIFFVCTTNLQNKAIDDRIQLAIAPHGQPVERKDPREINIDVDGHGQIYLAHSPITPSLLRTIIGKAAAEYGQDVPIIIRGDGAARHSAIQTVMNACTEAGVYRIKFAALKEKGR